MQRNGLSVEDNIYATPHHPTGGLSTLEKELTAATRIMLSSPNELSTPISDCVKCKQTKVITYALNSRSDVKSPNGRGVCYLSDVKLGRFRS